MTKYEKYEQGVEVVIYQKSRELVLAICGLETRFSVSCSFVVS